jgi:ubiquinone/menaquinone biosynthesis C-methylase UbiE
VNQLIKDPVHIFQAVSDPTRLRLLRLLNCEELNVQEMVHILAMNQPRISKHLAILVDAGWLRQRKEGTWSWYRAVPRGSFAGGGSLYDGVLQMADRLEFAGEDRTALALVVADRDARAGDFFAGAAERWDEIRRSFEHPDLKIGAVAALASPHLRVVDIGTGTGALLPWLVGSVSLVVAVDRSEAMLDRARRLALSSPRSGLVFQRADIQALPFSDGCFDVAYCSMVLHHVARPALAVSEMARVLRPGGKAVVMAFTKHNLTWMRDELAHQWLGFEQEEIETFFRRSNLRLGRYLVRRRAPPKGPAGGSTGAAKAGARSQRRWTWPDVFLAVAVKDAASFSPGIPPATRPGADVARSI